VTGDQSKVILLVHGWGGSYREAWEDSGWASRLRSAGRQIIDVNLPGHGCASGSHNPEDYGNIADELEVAVAQRLEELGLNKHCVIDAMGYSLGAKMILELACRQPQRFNRLVLVAIGENAFAPLKASAAIAEVMTHGVTPDTPPLLRQLHQYTLRAGNDPLAMAACMLRPQDAPVTPKRLAVVTSPCLIVCGAEDQVVLPADGLASALTESRLRLVDGVGHFDILDNVELIASASEFLALESTTPGE